MGAIITLRDEIESIITAMTDTTYVRAKVDELNKRLDKIKIGTGCIAAHIDLTTIEVPNESIGSYNYKVIPTQIFFFYKNKYIDDKTRDIDTLVDQATDKADEFYDKIIQSSVIDDVAPLPGYELERLEGFKRMDANVSGVIFNCSLPVNRETYYCAS